MSYDPGFNPGEIMEVVVVVMATRTLKTCKAPVESLSPTHQYSKSFFYRALPVA